MALSNYTELKSAVATELHMGNSLDNSLTDFIKRAEAKINRRLRLREQEILATYDYSSGTTSRFIALPLRFLELISMSEREASQDDAYYRTMRYVAPEEMNRYLATANSRPTHYTLRNYIEMNALPDQDYKIRMHYLKAWDLGADTTNWLLTNFPDIYLYGACLEATAHVQNDQRIAVWKSAFDEAVQEANLHASRSRNDITMSTDLVPTTHVQNILTGWSY